MDKDFRKTFDSCPHCGSVQRFCEQLGKELKDKGQARPEWTFAFDVRSGIVIDQVKPPLIGAKLPGFIIRTDICMVCGNIYATLLVRSEGSVQLPMPGEGKHPLEFPRNNPLTS